MSIETKKAQGLLYKINKPSHYSGGELNSYNKNLEEVKASIVLAFPDKYDVGVSNLGHRVLYERVNSYPQFYADRVYAPDVDLKKALENENAKLWTAESKQPLKNFDVIGFSLQYELAYPTVLKMLELSDISIYSKDRKEDEPIIIAGGPCAYNPLPLYDFIDAFSIGDGEDCLVEIMSLIEKSKENKLTRKEIIIELSKIEGVYVPNISNTVTKRVCNLETHTAPVKFPIPYSQPIHDRVVTEIRRGCGRMCRFCQPGHVNLPIRERSAKDIIDLTLKGVENTGYDEYSLLSLSSNDYSNIIPVVQELNCKFKGKHASVSLPSQRIDSFNMDLTNLVQSIRKSTITLAPEAGSQRLRDVINKNITREQIEKAILELYKNGYSKVKLYFILGLPTETYDDIDELMEMLSTIIYKANNLKRELKLGAPLNITGSMSVFIPKPFTPLQWCGQNDLDTVGEKIRYVKEKSNAIKGVKINIHDKFISQIEAALTRADKTICNYIYELYKHGCYLDSWDENFNYSTWKEVAQKCNIDLDYLANKTFGLNETLPWDFINIGVNKDWLINQYKLAMDSQNCPTCENKCVQCGVCPSLKVKKIIDKPYTPQLELEENKSEFRTKYRMVIDKKGALKFISHLDFQSTIIKAIKRTDLRVNYTEGFNPSPKISLGVALPLFTQSDFELVDFELLENYDVEEVKNKIEKEFKDLIKIHSLTKHSEKPTPPDILCQWAKYEIKVLEPLSKMEDLLYIKNRIDSSENLFISKKNKKGIEKQLDIKQSIKSVQLHDDKLYMILKTGQGDEIPSLRADVALATILPDKFFDITRVEFYDKDFKKI